MPTSVTTVTVWRLVSSLISGFRGCPRRGYREWAVADRQFLRGDGKAEGSGSSKVYRPCRAPEAQRFLRAIGGFFPAALEIQGRRVHEEDCWKFGQPVLGAVMGNAENGHDDAVFELAHDPMVQVQLENDPGISREAMTVPHPPTGWTMWAGMGRAGCDTGLPAACLIPWSDTAVQTPRACPDRYGSVRGTRRVRHPTALARCSGSGFDGLGASFWRISLMMVASHPRAAASVLVPAWRTTFRPAVLPFRVGWMVRIRVRLQSCFLCMQM